jgi:uncharacterized protein
MLTRAPLQAGFSHSRGACSRALLRTSVRRSEVSLEEQTPLFLEIGRESDSTALGCRCLAYVKLRILRLAQNLEEWGAAHDFLVYTQKSLRLDLFVYTLGRVEIQYDPKKSARNIAKRGLSFDRVREFDFGTARILEDDRVDYGETRWRAFGLLGGRLHALVYVEIDENAIRVISLRRANKHEVALYGS